MCRGRLNILPCPILPSCTLPRHRIGHTPGHGTLLAAARAALPALSALKKNERNRRRGNCGSCMFHQAPGACGGHAGARRSVFCVTSDALLAWEEATAMGGLCLQCLRPSAARRRPACRHKHSKHAASCVSFAFRGEGENSPVQSGQGETIHLVAALSCVALFALLNCSNSLPAPRMAFLRICNSACLRCHFHLRHDCIFCWRLFRFFAGWRALAGWRQRTRGRADKRRVFIAAWAALRLPAGSACS